MLCGVVVIVAVFSLKSFTPDIHTKGTGMSLYKCVYNIRFPKSIAKSKLLFAIGEKPIYYYDIVDNLTNP